MLNNGSAIAAILAATLALVTTVLNRRPTKSQEADSTFTRMERLIDNLEKSITSRTAEVETLKEELLEAEGEISRLREVVRSTTRQMNQMQDRMEKLEIVIGRAATLLKTHGVDTREFEV